MSNLINKGVVYVIYAAFIMLWQIQNVAGQIASQKVGSKIETVTVFNKGAQVNRMAKHNLKAGITQLVFTDISPNIDNRSIQVSGQGDFTIMSVSH